MRTSNYLVSCAALIAAGFVGGASAVECPDPGAPCPRPIQLGVSGTNYADVCSAGTLGSLLDVGVARVILSNNHVLARENAGQPGHDAIVQPGTLDNTPVCARQPEDQVGYLAHFIPLDFSGGENVFDLALAATSPAVVDWSGAIANIGQPHVEPYPGPPPIGLAVKKSGRTTGLTFGQIAAVNVTSMVTYSSGSALFRNQYRITPGAFSDGGDSGSLIVEAVADCARAVGLLFAGSQTSTLANPLNLFLEFTGFSVVGDESCPAGASARLAQDPEMQRAMRVQADNERAVLDTPGVIGMGIAMDPTTLEPVLEIYSDGNGTVAMQQALPATLDGLPVRVVRTGEFVAF